MRDIQECEPPATRSVSYSTLGLCVNPGAFLVDNDRSLRPFPQIATRLGKSVGATGDRRLTNRQLHPHCDDHEDHRPWDRYRRDPKNRPVAPEAWAAVLIAMLHPLGARLRRQQATPDRAPRWTFRGQGSRVQSSGHRMGPWGGLDRCRDRSRADGQACGSHAWPGAANRSRPGDRPVAGEYQPRCYARNCERCGDIELATGVLPGRHCLAQAEPHRPSPLSCARVAGISVPLRTEGRGSLLHSRRLSGCGV